ncbi:protein-export chaperone SecB [Variovorax sp. PAMC26660]|uniref:protein-export chaperone SecB n=1 Tax=Variovorax sp. PAMC26660 TaxID=2762322 RepID=UPI00164E8733|nr:protein-export chaperone SecB [Variovorax sp. PAMC26660]QNK67629.1 protein-export chaperone SecB [Variovorax sp. PAMC26660]
MLSDHAPWNRKLAVDATTHTAGKDFHLHILTRIDMFAFQSIRTCRVSALWFLVLEALICWSLSFGVQAQDAKFFKIERIYLKQAFVEQPRSPYVFLETELPDVNIMIDTSTQDIGKDLIEVSVLAKISVINAKGVVFTLSATQAGVFEIKGLSPAEMEIQKKVTLPQLLYPYLRANVTDLVMKASFPPVILAEIDFRQLKRPKEDARK